MDDREFWIQIRRGLAIVTRAIAVHKRGDPFWRAVLRGFNIVVRAIELRWHLPHTSIRTIGQTLPEPPSDVTLAQSSTEGIESDAV